MTYPKKTTKVATVRGAVMAEYTILVGAVALVCIGSFIALGVALVTSFESRRDAVLYPFP